MWSASGQNLRHLRAVSEASKSVNVDGYLRRPSNLISLVGILSEPMSPIEESGAIAENSLFEIKITNGLNSAAASLAQRMSDNEFHFSKPINRIIAENNYGPFKFKLKLELELERS